MLDCLGVSDRGSSLDVGGGAGMTLLWSSSPVVGRIVRQSTLSWRSTPSRMGAFEACLHSFLRALDWIDGPDCVPQSGSS
jgi:hypothetical protein